jgi:formamidase
MSTRLPTSKAVCAGVRFPGLIHPGLIGTAPSKELLDIWNQRERALVEAGPEGTTLGSVLHTRPLAPLPGVLLYPY